MPANRLSHHQATELAGDLLRELALLIGDEAAISQAMRRWHNVLGASRFGVVCMASVRITFRDCLISTPISDAPTGAVAFHEGNVA